MDNTDTFRDLSIAWMEAWKMRDKEELERLSAEEMIMFSAFGKNGYMDRDKAIQAMMNSFPISGYRYRFVNFLIYEKFAVVNSFLQVNLVSGLANENDVYQVTDVWKRQKREWKLICRQPSLSASIS